MDPVQKTQTTSILGTDHPLTLRVQANIADVLSSNGDRREAEALYRQCLRGREELLGIDHPSTNHVRYSLACLLSRDKRFEESILLRRQELAICEQRDGRFSVEALGSIKGLADDLLACGEIGEAEHLCLGALRESIRLFGDESSEAMTARYNLAGFFSEIGRRAEAIKLRRVEIAWCRDKNGNADPGTLISMHKLAIDLRETGELAEAETQFRELVAAQQQVLEPEDFAIGSALAGLAKTLEAAEMLEEAADYARQCLEHRTAHEGPDSWFTNRNRLNLARILYKLKRNSEALTLLDDLQISLNANPEQDDDDRELLSSTADLRGLIADKPRAIAPPGYCWLRCPCSRVPPLPIPFCTGSSSA